MKKFVLFVLAVLSLFSAGFSDFPYRHSFEFSLLGYRFSYSEEFEEPKGFVIGFPRSDEYGFTAGGEAGYKYYNPKSKLSLGAKFNYSRSVNHTYDGCLQGKYYWIAQDLSEEPYMVLIYEPIKIEDKDNCFFGVNIKIAYSIIANPKVNFDANASAAFGGWIRSLGDGLYEKYYWTRIYPGISIATKNNQNLGVISDLSFSIPVWQTMYLSQGNIKYKFDIGGKAGWKFEFGLAKYLASDRTWKVSYFHEYYGFKQSPYVQSGDMLVYEPSSSTINNGVKISFETGFGGK